MIFGLSPTDHRFLMFAVNATLGALVVYVETNIIPSEASAARWGLPWVLIAFVASPLWSFLLLHVVCRPEEYLPVRRPGDHRDKNGQQRIVIRIGYFLNITWMVVCSGQLLRLLLWH